MNEIWCCFESREPEYFDSEETALLGYKKWCEVNEEEFDLNIFYQCYGPLCKWENVWTKETINNYNPTQKSNDFFFVQMFNI